MLQVDSRSVGQYNEFILPICLPGGETTADDKNCYIAGWGSKHIL